MHPKQYFDIVPDEGTGSTEQIVTWETSPHPLLRERSSKTLTPFYLDS